MHDLTIFSQAFRIKSFDVELHYEKLCSERFKFSYRRYADYCRCFIGNVTTAVTPLLSTFPKVVLTIHCVLSGDGAGLLWRHRTVSWCYCGFWQVVLQQYGRRCFEDAGETEWRARIEGSPLRSHWTSVLWSHFGYYSVLSCLVDFSDGNC